MKILKELITDVNIWVVICCVVASILTAFDVMLLETKTLQIIIFCLLALSWTTASVIDHHH